MHLYEPDTIAALITAPGEAGVAIVRVSGPDALVLADRILRGRGPSRPSGPREPLCTVR